MLPQAAAAGHAPIERAGNSLDLVTRPLAALDARANLSNVLSPSPRAVTAEFGMARREKPQGTAPPR